MKITSTSRGNSFGDNSLCPNQVVSTFPGQIPFPCTLGMVQLLCDSRACTFPSLFITPLIGTWL